MIHYSRDIKTMPRIFWHSISVGHCWASGLCGVCGVPCHEDLQYYFVSDLKKERLCKYCRDWSACAIAQVS